MKMGMTALCLALALPAFCETDAWAPDKELVFTGRKLEIFQHDAKKEWGYAAPQRDTFLLLHPKQARPNAPLYVSVRRTTPLVPAGWKPRPKRPRHCAGAGREVVGREEPR